MYLHNRLLEDKLVKYVDISGVAFVFLNPCLKFLFEFSYRVTR